MIITIRSFAMIREIMGDKQTDIEIQDGTTISSALTKFVLKFPKTKKHLYSGEKLDSNFLIAVNGEKIEPTQYDEYVLKESDELAIIPPAGGG